MIDDIVDLKASPEFYTRCFSSAFWFVISNLQEPFAQSALSAPILQEKPSSPFISTDLPLVEISTARSDSLQPCSLLGMHC